MKIYRIAQEELEDEDPILEDIVDIDKWTYKAYGPGYWIFGDYTIDADTPLEQFEVKVNNEYLGIEDTLEEALQLALSHYEGYAEVSAQQEVTPYDKIEKLFGYTDNPELAGYILQDGSLVNLNRPNIDHRAVTNDGSTKSMQEFIADGNVRMSFSRNYAFFDIKSKPTASQKSALRKIVSLATNGVDIVLDKGMGEYDPRRETYEQTDSFAKETFDAGCDPHAVIGYIESFYSENKVYPSQFARFLNENIGWYKFSGKGKIYRRAAHVFQVGEELTFNYPKAPYRGTCKVMGVNEDGTLNVLDHSGRLMNNFKIYFGSDPMFKEML